ncbi:MAG: hypothetical protein IKC04_04995 [Oscillospiraceae bacterium]|nr:hypothetical protein [Oscillospiraceae bacterium]MBR2978261.1 hypothetical protein [Oscillospiraceae bacterium]MBR6709882.1 hypothetical protein [Clostridia bacterium]
MRNIDARFIGDLLNGELAYFLNRVKENRDGLSLEIRDGYVNIYYKGGNLLKITQKRNGYSFFFDAKYCKHENGENFELLNGLPTDDAECYKTHFKQMQQEMDDWFAEHPKAERDYQHRLLVNNPQIVDIEYQIGRTMRLDMLMFSGGRLLITENKYGTGAIGGKAGLAEHYEDICRVLREQKLLDELTESVCSISHAKHALGLTDTVIGREDIKCVEILFLLANYNPDSQSLYKEMEKMDGSVPANILMLSGDEIKLDLTRAEGLLLRA